jgi:hypothetical protein
MAERPPVDPKLELGKLSALAIFVAVSASVRDILAP